MEKCSNNDFRRIKISQKETGIISRMVTSLVLFKTRDLLYYITGGQFVWINSVIKHGGDVVDDKCVPAVVKRWCVVRIKIIKLWKKFTIPLWYLRTRTGAHITWDKWRLGVHAVPVSRSSFNRCSMYEKRVRKSFSMKITAFFSLNTYQLFNCHFFMMYDFCMKSTYCNA